MKTVLLVAMPESIHVARICASIARSGWKVHLFPCHDARPHPDLTDLVLYDPGNALAGRTPPGVERRSVLPRSRLAARPNVRAAALAGVIARLKPDIVHAQELQHGGYLSAAARRLLPRYPPLIASIWGSDISMRSLLPDERPRIVNVLRHADVVMAECERDLRTARALGYQGETVLPAPVGGGFDVVRLSQLRSPGPTSARRTIAIKGYQGWAGRSQVALRAIERCGSLLAGYRLAVYLANPDTAVLARRLAERLELEVEIISAGGVQVPHEDILAMHGRSRVSIGLSASDGISTSFLEAVCMGSFPIQSGTACVDEWITDGLTGFIVPPEDPEAVAKALQAAIQNDALVDRAAALNAELVRRRLDQTYLRQQLMILYDRVAEGQIAQVRSH